MSGTDKRDPLPRPLSLALSAMLPEQAQTVLLRACLHPGEAGRAAWHECRARNPDLIGEFRRDIDGTRRLAPLLYEAIRRSGAEADAPLLTALRTARVREELRAREYRRIVHAVLGELHEAGIPLLVLKGAALADTVYRDPVLRHCHDIDLLLRGPDRDAAVERLARAGLRPRGGAGRSGDAVELVHPSGLPILLHARLFRHAYYDMAWEAVEGGAEPATVAGREAFVPSPALNLLHACGHACYSPSRASLLWACDAWMLATRSRTLDWDAFLEAVADSRLALPMHVMLRYLADHLAAPIPAAVLDRVAAAAGGASRLARDVALFGARQGRRAALARILRSAGSWRARAVVAWWLLVPSTAYVRWAYGLRGGAALPLFYLRRPIAFLGRRLAALRRRPGRARPAGRAASTRDAARAASS